MKRTRRTVLATVGGSAGALAAGTLAASRWSSGPTEASAIDGDSAVLELTDDALEAHGDLFDGDARRPPVTFDVVNGRSEPVSVTLAADDGQLNAAEATTTGGGDLVVGSASSDRLEPGSRLSNVVVELDPTAAGRATRRTIPVTITAIVDGEGTAEGDAELALERPGFVVEETTLEVDRVDEDVEHRWTLSGLDTGGVALEALRFDYTDLETQSSNEFSDAESLSTAITADGTERESTIEHRTANRLDVALEESLETDGVDVEIAVTVAGSSTPPAQHPEGRSGATLELVGDGYRARVDGIRHDA